MSQAAYHGVPLIALPFFAEQRENADKAVRRVRNCPNTCTLLACLRPAGTRLPRQNLSPCAILGLLSQNCVARSRLQPPNDTVGMNL